MGLTLFVVVVLAQGEVAPPLVSVVDEEGWLALPDLAAEPSAPPLVEAGLAPAGATPASVETPTRPEAAAASRPASAGLPSAAAHAGVAEPAPAATPAAAAAAAAVAAPATARASARVPSPADPAQPAPRAAPPSSAAESRPEVESDGRAAARDDAAFWQVTALATANIPLSLDGADFLYGFRGELDVWRVSALVSFDRTGVTPLTLSETRSWSALLGASVFAKKYLRLRALGGLAFLATEKGATFAPSLGATARLGWRFIALEGALLGSVGAFQQLDARAELVLQGGVVELHVGYRARLQEVLLGGPSVALGLSF